MQVKKEEITNKILEAATFLFREVGYKQTSIAKIAQKAEISTGNLYHYFKSKDELFEAVLPKEFASSFRAKLNKATRLTFGHSKITNDNPSLRNYWKAIEDLLSISSLEKDRLLILLTRADGTSFEPFREEAINLMTEQALKYARSTDPTFERTPDVAYLVREIYSSFITTITNILRDSESPTETQRRLILLRTYHLTGLKALFGRGKS